MHCASLQSLPTNFQPQTTESPPTSIYGSFAADVMKRCRQLVLVLRESVSSYTASTFIPSERQEDLREGLIVLFSSLGLIDVNAQVRVDPAPGFVALANDSVLSRHGIPLVIGHAKNKNKNPIAERAIQELGSEILKQSPEGGPISKITLAQVTARLNSRIRHSGLSAFEVWTQRDRFTVTD